jgi:hypothetical protein
MMQRTTQVEEKELGTEDLVKMLRNGATVEIKDVKITGWNVKPHYEKRAVVTEVKNEVKNEVTLEMRDLVKIIKELL